MREKVCKLPQLVDIYDVSFLPPGENPDQLRVLRLEKKLSLRQIAKATGHSISYLQQQLRKFGLHLDSAGKNLAPYGWDWKGKTLICNDREQAILRDMLRLRKRGDGYEKIAKTLNERSVQAKVSATSVPLFA